MNNKDRLLEELTKIDSKSCPYKCNFHCHTLYSDGSLDAIDMYKQANTIGLTNLAITDHHSTNAFLDIAAFLKTNDNYKNYKTAIWSGVEISGILLECMVHIIGLGFNVQSEYIKPYIQGNSVKGDLLQADTIVRNINNSGGISILAHPARYRLPFFKLINEAHEIGFDGVEVWYDYDRSYNWKPSHFTCNEISKMVKNKNMISTCGTDTHGLSLLRR